MSVLEIVGLFLVGVLAGEEFIVRYGVHPALSRLDDRSHLRARLALVKRLMVVVPAIMIPSVLVNVATLFGDPSPWRIAGVAALVAFLLFSFLGTVPLNIKVNDTWNADAPPADWKAVVARWVLIDTFRSSAALLAFALLAVAMGLE